MSAVPRLVQKFRVRELAKRLPDAPLPSTKTAKLQNPFLPFKDPKTQRWCPPLYSLRRQAVLVKAAKASGTLGLLPPGPKASVAEVQEAVAQAHATRHLKKRLDASWKTPEATKAAGRLTGDERAGLRRLRVQWVGEVKERVVPGADVGARLYAGKKRMFKGHKWQRLFDKRTKKIAVRVRDMPKRIKKFKTNYSRRRASPIARRMAKKKQTLPF